MKSRNTTSGPRESGSTSRDWTSFRASLLPLALLAFGAGAAFAAEDALPECTPKGKVLMYKTDWGINQWKKGMYDYAQDPTKIGFAEAGAKTMFDGAESGQVLTVMRGKQNLEGLSQTKATSVLDVYESMTAEERAAEVDRTYDSIMARVDRSLDSGNRTLELQSIQNIGSSTLGTESRQRAVTQFTGIVDDAYDRVYMELSRRGYDVSYAAHVGSNGGRASARAFTPDRKYTNYVSYNSRASTEELDIVAAGIGDKNMYTYLTRGDYRSGSGATNSQAANFRAMEAWKTRHPASHVYYSEMLKRPPSASPQGKVSPRSLLKSLGRLVTGGKTHVLNMYKDGEFSVQEMVVDTRRTGRVNLSEARVMKGHELHDLPNQGISTTKVDCRAGVGGVMLSGTAQVDTADERLQPGAFSLVLNGEDASVDPTDFRRFVTALWAVYFGQVDPGISIDPIARGSERQLVRYIGRVKNTDLGRVMRTADYVMKKWSIGTERPVIQGFKNPDDYAAMTNVLYLGAMSRFWFVPQDMRFKSTGRALIFDSGRMTVQTEFLAHSTLGLRADPANEAFAEFFTSRYDEIARRHPVFGELFDYAKLVALSKYLKESGVPLYWFLMANRDLVLTEESPGTVAALFKDSAHFQGVHVEGGVQITSSDEYILDSVARGAIQRAFDGHSTSRLLRSHDGAGSGYVPEPVSVDIADRKYTIVPQHSISSGTDRRGIRYQTDVSLRAEGYELSGRSLRALAPELQRREVWDVLRPQVQGLSDEQLQLQMDDLFAEAWERAGVRAKETMKRLSDLEGRDYPTEAEFARDLEFVIGKEALERFGDLIVSRCRYVSNCDLVRYFDPRRPAGYGQFGPGWNLLIPYRIEFCEGEREDFLNVTLPSRLRVSDLVTGVDEVLQFDGTSHAAAGYYPEEGATSNVAAVYLLSNATCRLVDRIGNEFQFDGHGRLTKSIISEEHAVTLEYLDDSTSLFEADPYRAEPTNEAETVEFRGVTLPKFKKITDSHGYEEVLVFDAGSRLVGYVPETKEGSRFEFLALMSDRSYRLLDRHENELAFDHKGRFLSFRPDRGQQVVRAVKAGKHAISFRYALDLDGLLIASAAVVSEDELGSRPTYVVNYSYDEDMTLVSRSVETPGGGGVFERDR